MHFRGGGIGPSLGGSGYGTSNVHGARADVPRFRVRFQEKRKKKVGRNIREKPQRRRKKREKSENLHPLDCPSFFKEKTEDCLGLT